MALVLPKQGWNYHTVQLYISPNPHLPWVPSLPVQGLPVILDQNIHDKISSLIFKTRAFTRLIGW